MITFSVQIQRF